jgi:hypothetical protein
MYPLVVKSLAVAILSGLAACAGDTNPVRDTLAAVGAGPKSAEAPDFVARSRPARLDYLPIGAAPQARPTPARTPDEVKAAEGELEAVRARNENAARRAVQSGETPEPQPAGVPARRKPAADEAL